MNKIDLFGEKILYSGRHLRLYQPDFKGTTHFLHLCLVDPLQRLQILKIYLLWIPHVTLITGLGTMFKHCCIFSV